MLRRRLARCRDTYWKSISPLLSVSRIRMAFLISLSVRFIPNCCKVNRGLSLSWLLQSDTTAVYSYNNSSFYHHVRIHSSQTALICWVVFFCRKNLQAMQMYRGLKDYRDFACQWPWVITATQRIVSYGNNSVHRKLVIVYFLALNVLEEFSKNSSRIFIKSWNKFNIISKKS